MKHKIVILTGAGISAESGIQTFRGAGGLWEGHRIEDVASPDGWRRNRELVLEF
jgi:NAD-dependent deacetylase